MTLLDANGNDSRAGTGTESDRLARSGSICHPEL
jgi:hypothetical protein